jgi:thiol-disulfide isomerase/thioredoxin
VAQDLVRPAAGEQAAPSARGRAARRSRSAVLLLAAILLAPGCGRVRQAASPQLVDTKTLQARVAAERGHPLLVAFWATWCQPCVEEFPDLVALQGEAPSGLRVLAVSLDSFLSGRDTPRIVEEYLAAHPAALQHAIYNGTQDSLFSAFDLPGNIPYSILYAADGRVLQRFSGRALPGEVRAALASRGS